RNLDEGNSCLEKRVPKQLDVELERWRRCLGGRLSVGQQMPGFLKQVVSDPPNAAAPDWTAVVQGLAARRHGVRADARIEGCEMSVNRKRRLVPQNIDGALQLLDRHSTLAVDASLGRPVDQEN